MKQECKVYNIELCYKYLRDFIGENILSNRGGQEALQCGQTGLNTPFEMFFNQALTPFEEFIRDESAGGILLMLCAMAALIIANTPLSEAYDKILHIQISIGFGEYAITESVHHWINDGLMALFFLIIGLSAGNP